MVNRKRLGKIGVEMFEFAAQNLDTFRFPLIRKRHENAVRKLFRKANETAKVVGLPLKTYKRVNSKGFIEEIV